MRDELIVAIWGRPIDAQLVPAGILVNGYSQNGG
jgi:hypothetical protein